MTDADIVTLYWARDEQAIAQTAQKFGAYCRKIAMNWAARKMPKNAKMTPGWPPGTACRKTGRTSLHPT